MIVGSLLEVMCLDEDSASARQAKIRNRIAKNPNNTQSFVYDGTDEGYLKELGNRLTPKQFKQVAKEVKRQPGGMAAAGASFNPIGNIYAVNGARPDVVNNMKAVNPDGTVNMNSPLLQHERQHKLQFDYINSLVGKGKNARTRSNQIGKRLKASYPNLGKISSDPNEVNKYLAHPLEYDANAAAKSGQVRFGTGSKQAVDTVLGRAQNPLKISPEIGAYMTTALTDPKTRKAAQNQLNQSQSTKRRLSQDELPAWVLEKMQGQQQQNDNQYSAAEIAQMNKFNKQRNKTLSGKTPVVQQQPVVQQVQPVQPQQVVQQPVQTVQPRPVVQQTVTPQQARPVQPQPADTVQPRPYANAYNTQLQQKAIAAGGATNRNTGITYYKKNGKLMSTAMQ